MSSRIFLHSQKQENKSNYAEHPAYLPETAVPVYRAALPAAVTALPAARPIHPEAPFREAVSAQAAVRRDGRPAVSVQEGPLRAVLPEAVMEHLPAAEAVLLVILPVREEAIPPDGAVDITERKARITRSLPLQV